MFDKKEKCPLHIKDTHSSKWRNGTPFENFKGGL